MHDGIAAYLSRVPWVPLLNEPLQEACSISRAILAAKMSAEGLRSFGACCWVMLTPPLQATRSGNDNVCAQHHSEQNCPEPNHRALTPGGCHVLLLMHGCHGHGARNAAAHAAWPELHNAHEVHIVVKQGRQGKECNTYCSHLEGLDVPAVGLVSLRVV